MVKMMFMLFRKNGVTREQCVNEWTGEQHLAFRDVLHSVGLRRYVQNLVTGEEHEGGPDGIGELWFDDSAAMDRVLNHAAWLHAFEDAERFADLERSYPLIVEESVIIE